VRVHNVILYAHAISDLILQSFMRKHFRDRMAVSNGCRPFTDRGWQGGMGHRVPVLQPLPSSSRYSKRGCGAI